MKWILILFAVLFFSCQSEFRDVQELNNYIQKSENGLIRVNKLGDIEIVVRYIPGDLFIKREFDSGTKDIDLLKMKYYNNYYFVLTMKVNGQDLLNNTAVDKELFSKLNNELSFNLDERVKLVDQKDDTVQLSDFVFPKMYEFSKSTEILMVFKRDQIKTKNFKIIVDIFDWPQKDKEFNFSKNSIENLQNLIIE
ncbi:MAG: hypothetical protein J0L87_06025 [Bacteroidetes bacterium]|nr:hypothetical protein [Bacteroidota bacterium]